MASSMKTPNMELTQFKDSDSPSWLTDYNNDMMKIDQCTLAKTTYDTNGDVAAAGGITGYTNIESGSNANGTYIKFPDGTLICTKHVETQNYAMNVAAGSTIHRGEIIQIGDFAMPFVGTPSIQKTMYGTAGQTCWQMNFSSNACALAREGMAGSLFTAMLDVTAIGRWK